MKINPVLAKDFYKVGHKFQYPANTSLVYSNFTPRSDHLSTNPFKDGKMVFFGLQGVLKWLLQDVWNEGFFEKPKEEVVAAYKRRIDNALGKDSVAVDHIAALHDLGYLPIIIKALPEGSRVGMKVPVFTIYNTHPDFFWLTNMLETSLSAECWKSSTTATTANAYYKLLERYAELTGAPKEFIPWQGHDFSMRGQSGIHDASQSGAAHLLSFFGTDTIPAIDFLENYYGADSDKELVGGSVPATEHSVMCMGSKESEINTFSRLINDVYPTGVVSIVSDTWDFWKVITEYAATLKEDILNRQPNELGLAKTVFRPDSGDPVEVICGESYLTYGSLEEAINSLKEIINEECQAECGQGVTGDCEPSKLVYIQDEDEFYNLSFIVEYISQWQDRGDKLYSVEEVAFSGGEVIEPTPEQKGAVQCLWETFGGTVTPEGYKILNERVGLIYGDSITLERAESILAGLEAKGFASCNIVFGIGSYTYQHVTRDSYGFAMKATYGVVDGKGVEIFKDPVTDSGIKKSAKGLLRVEKEGDDFVLYDQQTWAEESTGELKTVFLNGALENEQTLDEIRQRLMK